MRIKPITRLGAFPSTLKLALALAVLLSGCASSSKNVNASYVSSLQYQAYDCTQLKDEATKIQARVIELGGRLDKAANNDAAITAGAVLFWPMLFALGGNKNDEAEYARLKGEYDAIQKASIQKSCDFSIPTLIPTAPTPPVQPGMNQSLQYAVPR